jgi:hypothetical protein
MVVAEEGAATGAVEWLPALRSPGTLASLPREVRKIMEASAECRLAAGRLPALPPEADARVRNDTFAAVVAARQAALEVWAPIVAACREIAAAQKGYSGKLAPEVLAAGRAVVPALAETFMMPARGDDVAAFVGQIEERTAKLRVMAEAAESERRVATGGGTAAGGATGGQRMPAGAAAPGLALPELGNPGVQQVLMHAIGGGR